MMAGLGLMRLAYGPDQLQDDDAPDVGPQALPEVVAPDEIPPLPQGGSDVHLDHWLSENRRAYGVAEEGGAPAPEVRLPYPAPGTMQPRSQDDVALPAVAQYAPPAMPGRFDAPGAVSSVEPHRAAEAAAVAFGPSRGQGLISWFAGPERLVPQAGVQPSVVTWPNGSNGQEGWASNAFAGEVADSSGAHDYRAGSTRQAMAPRAGQPEGRPSPERRERMQDTVYRPGTDGVAMVPVFKIFPLGSVHESIAEAAARQAGMPFDSRLEEGVRWPDIPGKEPDQTSYWGLRNMDKPGTIANDSHHGSRQYWHSMVPSDGSYSNGEVVDKIVGQALDWYQAAQTSGDIFSVGKMLHMIQDSFSRSHVIRNDAGEVVQFQNYNEQDGHEHGIADEIPKGGTWRNVPGAEAATAASAAILELYKNGAGADAVEKYLRENVFRLAPDAATVPAGGSAPQFQQRNPPESLPPYVGYPKMI